MSSSALSSAQKARDGLRVLVTTSAVGIAIRSHGPGVPAGALAKIFEPFYRPEDARMRTTGGAGLGLAIVKSCVEACGGSKTVTQAAPNGLSVCIRLPREP